MNQDECVFCDIAAKRALAQVVWADDEYVAFLNIYPVKTGHLLLVPKKHTDYFWNLSEDEYVTFMRRVYRAARELKRITQADKVYLKFIGEHVAHVHAQLIPSTFEKMGMQPLTRVGQYLRQNWSSLGLKNQNTLVQ